MDADEMNYREQMKKENASIRKYGAHCNICFDRIEDAIKDTEGYEQEILKNCRKDFLFRVQIFVGDALFWGVIHTDPTRCRYWCDNSELTAIELSSLQGLQGGSRGTSD